ncbi:MAG: TolC family protein [Alphaproteobacteria bacterium]|nr:TolC family protein [Alphaproteobacteria bacterium]
MRPRFPALVLAATLLAGCSGLPHAALFGRQAPASETLSIAEKDRWWLAFNDPLMNQLITEVMGQNLDIQTALSRKREAAALEQAAFAPLLPEVNVAGTASRGNRNFGLTAPRSIAQGGLEASWELDISGRLRAGSDAAAARALAGAVRVPDVAGSVAADVAIAVVQWRQAQQTLKETKDLLASQDDQLKLAAVRARAGLTDNALAERAAAQRAQTATQLPLAQAAAEAAQYQLERLLGMSSGSLSQRLEAHRADALTLPSGQPVTDIPLERIRQRPDVRAAQAGLLAAKAELAQAEAALWPRITLGAFFGAQDTPPGLPFASNPIWAVTSGLAMPVLNFGRLSSLVDAADERSQQAALSYQNVALTAMQETKTALADYLGAKAATAQQQDALAHRKLAVKLARERYTRGLTDMSELTTAQTELDQATLTLIERKTQTSIAYIRLQRALGVELQPAADNT